MMITPYRDDRFDELLAFITRLNDDPAHHIGYLGQGIDDIRHDLGELSVPLVEGFRLADEHGRLVGAMGYDADPALGRVWLMGPFVDHPDWPATAAALYDTMLASLPAGLTQLELFGHLDNENLAHLARQRGFTALPEVHLLTIERPLFLPPVVGVIDLPPHLEDQFRTLHDTVFPNTYYSADQLLAMRNDRHRLLVSVDGETLTGYVFFKMSPDIREGYLDFIAVAESARQRGLGRRLLAAVLRGVFEEPVIDHLNLTVNGDNLAACRLYVSAGFEVVRSMRGYRRSRAEPHTRTAA